MNLPVWIEVGYFIAAVLFILGLKAMSSPKTATKGFHWSGFGMVLAVVVTLFIPDLQNLFLIMLALIIGVGLAWYYGQQVKMTEMPQMVAIYNGMGGGAAAAIAAAELSHAPTLSTSVIFIAALGTVIGLVSFSGSCVAFAKLHGLLTRNIVFEQQRLVNGALFFIVLFLVGYIVFVEPSGLAIFVLFLITLLLGVLVTVPVGGADMPVVISLFNAFTGLAVGFEGYVLNNPALIISGIVVGAAGTLLTLLMAKSMNRSVTNVLFTPIQVQGSSSEITGEMKEIQALDAASLMSFAREVIIVPGYGMAVAHAQQKVWEMAELLQANGINVRFAIHPVAGRMPGHMNVLLAEAGVPYDNIFDLDEINSDFASADVTLIIGANDVVNPAARTDESSPIFGMPILNADHSDNVIVIKRGQGKGYSGVENLLFFNDNTRMLYGSAQNVAADLIAQIKTMV